MPRLRKTGRPLVGVIDDEPIVCREIKRGLEKDDLMVETFSDGESVLERLAVAPFDLILCDLVLPGLGGMDVLRTVKELRPNVEVIIITAHASLETAMEAVRNGAFHYVTKPIRVAEIRALANRALEKVRLVKEKKALKAALFSQGRGEMIGSSPAMREVFDLIAKVSLLNCNVLVQGESGSGKELVARALHRQGPRRDKPFVSFNCGGFAEELIANELFGHERGAFTGARETKIGLLEAAHTGAIFLDEISEMPWSMQVKLLRFVEERTLLRVGGVKPVEVDVRLIAAGNVDLREMVRERKFREDLFYRLNVVRIHIPPLRARKDDIPLLARHFLAKFNRSFDKKVAEISAKAMDILMDYPYPGNVRELENIIERAVALADGSLLRARDLPADMQQLTVGHPEADEWPTLEEKEKDYIQRVLVKTGFRKNETADILGLPRTTLWRKMKRLGLE
ncbi:MAG: sigma-54 dependent transcriptional regulator [Pseudomonadota bacterium]